MTIAEEFRAEGRVQGRDQVLIKLVMHGFDDARVMALGGISARQLAALKAKLNAG